MKPISSKHIIKKVFNVFKPNDSDWLGNSVDYIGDAIQGIGTHIGFKSDIRTTKVVNHRVLIPNDVESLEYIKYKGRRLPLALDKTIIKLAKESITTKSTNLEEVDKDVLRKLDELVEFYNGLESKKETSTPEEIIELTERQNDLLKEITKLANSIKVSNPLEKIHGEWYVVDEDGFIYTSFQDGEIDLYCNCFILDKDNYPMIVDTFNYKEAVFYYLCYMLILSGYRHPILEQNAFQLWEDYRYRAANEGKLRTIAEQDRFAKRWTCLKFNINEFK